MSGTSCPHSVHLAYLCFKLQPRAAHDKAAEGSIVHSLLGHPCGKCTLTPYIFDGGQLQTSTQQLDQTSKRECEENQAGSAATILVDMHQKPRLESHAIRGVGTQLNVHNASTLPPYPCKVASLRPQGMEHVPGTQNHLAIVH